MTIRASGGAGVAVENPLPSELVAELHPGRNPGLQVGALTAARVAGCGGAARTGMSGKPPSTGAADLIAEWHTSLNGRSADEVPAGSHKLFWWRCSIDPAHLWRAQPKNRVRAGSGCPYCAGKRPTPSYSLAAALPDVAAQWHPQRNGRLSPTDVLPLSNRKVWWRCPAGHEWPARVANRANRSGCPYCVRDGYGDLRDIERPKPRLHGPPEQAISCVPLTR